LAPGSAQRDLDKPNIYHTHDEENPQLLKMLLYGLALNCLVGLWSLVPPAARWAVLKQKLFILVAGWILNAKTNGGVAFGRHTSTEESPWTTEDNKRMTEILIMLTERIYGMERKLSVLNSSVTSGQLGLS